MSRAPRLVAAALALVAAAGCASVVDVRPWQKGDLARPEMRFDTGPLEARMVDQVHTSKEASSGGVGVGGGGCGCN